MNMSDVWEDITGIERGSSRLKNTQESVSKTNQVEKIKPSPVCERNSAIQDDRTEEVRCLVLNSFDKVEDYNSVMYAQKGLSRFTLWPKSNCYHSESENRYGVGIDRLCKSLGK